MRELPGTGKAVRIMRGRAPDGALYEVMVSPNRDVGACIMVRWPYVPRELGGGACGGFPPEGVYGRREPEKVAARPHGFVTQVPHATRHGMLTGFARPSVSRVRVVYTGRDGERHDAHLRLTRVHGRLQDRIEAEGPARFWVAFLPRSAGRHPNLEVIAYDDGGSVLSRIDYRG